MTASETLPASSTLESFLEQGIDRCAFIETWLSSRGIPGAIVTLAGKRHLVVRFDAEAYDSRYRMKTLVAHYDRAPCTSGANDNSAACFQLMLLAERLQSGRTHETATHPHNVIIIFTDGEEAAGTGGIAGQGSFTLGEGLRKLGMTDSDVFVFDACGRGDTLVISTSGHERKTGPTLAGRLSVLHERAAECAAAALPDSWLRLPTPYSDNAGFLASGIASQVFTVLPYREAEALRCAVAEAGDSEHERELADAIVAPATRGDSEAVRDAIPETWRLMHTEKDNAASLTASAFRLMETLLDNIARANFPVC